MIPVAFLDAWQKGLESGDYYLKLCDERIKIPLAGTISSLNVSVAAGIIIFETLRQRNQ